MEPQADPVVDLQTLLAHFLDARKVLIRMGIAVAIGVFTNLVLMVLHGLAYLYARDACPR